MGNFVIVLGAGKAEHKKKEKRDWWIESGGILIILIMCT